MNRFYFGSQVDMANLDLSSFLLGSVTGVSESEIDIADSNGDTTTLTGTFDPLGPTGVVTGIEVLDPSSNPVFAATNLNIDVVQLLSHAGDAASLAQDLFGGNSRIQGSDQDDALLGGDGKDILLGGAGEDILNGQAGYDRLIGGLGVDLFVFQDSGKDQIRDFDALSIDHDQIEIDAQGVDGMDKLDFHDNSHGDAIIKWFDDGVVERLVVRGVDSATLMAHPEDFTFGPQVHAIHPHGDLTL